MLYSSLDSQITFLINSFLFCLGKAPRVVAHGGFSGLVPDSSQFAYELAMSASVKDVILYCSLQMTKDGVGMCQNDIRLDNSTNIQSIFPKGQKTYTINGEQVRGWFSNDFTSDQLFNVSCKCLYMYILFSELQA